jgi:nuclear protein localization family protein 4
MVDHIEFASKEVVDRFIDGWRRGGVQRFGFLIGRYEPYTEVPMGIKAVVEAIHEPGQRGEVDGVTVGLPWEDEKRVTELGSWTYYDSEMQKKGQGQLEIVGQIFTDLTPQPDDRSKLIYKRHPQSFFMSSLEAIFAAKMQAAHPTRTKSSRTGEFGSRFITVIVTGTEEGTVDLKGFQVSEQAVAMVQADMISASTEPHTVIVKKETEGRYIPEVFYRSKNQYGIEVKESAKPTFPVDYLLVNVSIKWSILLYLTDRYLDHPWFPKTTGAAIPLQGPILYRESTWYRGADARKSLQATIPVGCCIHYS